MRKAISVIIPVYNKERYLRVLLNQIMNQSFSDFECILVNDGSADLSGQICDEFANRDERFRVFHTPNGGVSRARNLALNHAEGEYITFIDADDEIHEDFLKNLYDVFQNNNVDMVISNHIKFWDHQNKTQYSSYKMSGPYDMKELLPSFAKIQRDTGVYGWCVAKLFPRCFIADICFDEKLKLAEDFDFYLKLYKKITRVYIDDAAYYYYRQEADNSSLIVGDYDIDYFSQLIIFLRYKTFLNDMDVYSGENKAILEERISNYIFFSMFYCDLNLLRDRFKELGEIYRGTNIKLIGKGMMQKCLFCSLKNKSYIMARSCISVYRILRRFFGKKGNR